MEDNFFEMILAEKEKKEMAVLMACNEKTETFGLSLTEQEAQEREPEEIPACGIRQWDP